MKENQLTSRHTDPVCIWILVVADSWTGNICKRWPCSVWSLGWLYRCCGLSGRRQTQTCPPVSSWPATPTPASSQEQTLTSSTLGHSFQLHIWLLVARLFMDIRQTVRASVPTITSHGWEATSRPWSLNRRANMIAGCRLATSGHSLNCSEKSSHHFQLTRQDVSSMSYILVTSTMAF